MLSADYNSRYAREHRAERNARCRANAALERQANVDFLGQKHQHKPRTVTNGVICIHSVMRFHGRRLIQILTAILQGKVTLIR